MARSNIGRLSFRTLTHDATTFADIWCDVRFEVRLKQAPSLGREGVFSFTSTAPRLAYTVHYTTTNSVRAIQIHVYDLKSLVTQDGAFLT
jgi:hypothetical protein